MFITDDDDDDDGGDAMNYVKFAKQYLLPLFVICRFPCFCSGPTASELEARKPNGKRKHSHATGSTEQFNR